MYPILLRLGPVTLYSYGAMVALAFLVGIYVTRREVARRGIDAAFIDSLGMWAIVAGIIGSRAFYVLGNLSWFAHQPLEILAIWRGGLVYYGGVMFAALVGIIIIKRRGLPVGQVLDAVALALPLAHAVGRIGCFLNGCCFGKISQLPWAVSFPPGGFAQSAQVAEGLIGPTEASLAVHPVQLYSVSANLTIFLLLWILRKRTTHAGQLFLQYLVAYPSARFFLEFFRGDRPPVLGPITLAQILSLAVVTLAVGFSFARVARARITAGG